MEMYWPGKRLTGNQHVGAEGLHFCPVLFLTALRIGNSEHSMAEPSSVQCPWQFMRLDGRIFIWVVQQVQDYLAEI